MALLPGPGAAGVAGCSGPEQRAATGRAAPAGAGLLPVQHPCGARPIRMLRCTGDTVLLPPGDHHQDHEQHPGDDVCCPSGSNLLHTTASNTTRSSGTPSPQALGSRLTPSHAPRPPGETGCVAHRSSRDRRLQDGAVQGAAVAGDRVAADGEAVLEGLPGPLTRVDGPGDGRVPSRDSPRRGARAPRGAGRGRAPGRRTGRAAGGRGARRAGPAHRPAPTARAGRRLPPALRQRAPLGLRRADRPVLPERHRQPRGSPPSTSWGSLERASCWPPGWSAAQCGPAQPGWSARPVLAGAPDWVCGARSWPRVLVIVGG